MMLVGCWFLSFYCCGCLVSSAFAFGTVTNLPMRRLLRPIAVSTSVNQRCRAESSLDRLYADSLSSSSTSSTSSPPSIQWEVYVDQSKGSLDKGGGATLDAFLALAPPDRVRVQPAILLPKIKSKGPAVRCIYVPSSSSPPSDVTSSSRRTPPLTSMDIGAVDSVDKVYRILTRHMRVTGISNRLCDCLKWKYRANAHLEAKKTALAIDAYNKALTIAQSLVESIHSKNNTNANDSSAIDAQMGSILLMRATAYLQRAASHKEQLKSIVTELTSLLPNTAQRQTLYEQVLLAHHQPAIAQAVIRRVAADHNVQEQQYRRTQYRHGLYQYALLQACQDSLRATQLLPYYATSWLRAGEILAELWKIKESIQYYERAVALDPSLTKTVGSMIVRLTKRQELLDNARAFGWSEDTLRLALDVAG